jgi:membrane protease YdiL (CAAX protease family)
VFFLLKRTVVVGLAGLAAQLALGIGLRAAPPSTPPLRLTASALLTGLAALGVVLLSDGLIHGGLTLTFRDAYRRRYRELAGLFRVQTVAAMLTGSAMAGLGEELVFRGCGTGPLYLFGMAVIFAAVHSLRGELWPFTFWSLWEGTLFAVVMLLTGELTACMTAHFLHDLIGFGIFRYQNRRSALPPTPSLRHPNCGERKGG